MKTINEIKNTFGSLIDYRHLEALTRNSATEYYLLEMQKPTNYLASPPFIGSDIICCMKNLKTPVLQISSGEMLRRTLLISGIVALDNDENLIEIVLNETLALAINRIITIHCTTTNF